MEYVICYDIADDGRRNRVADTLLDYGPRCQESVFVVHLDHVLYRRMVDAIVRLIDPATDKVHIFAMCASCEANATALGLGTIPKDEQFYIL